MSFDEEPEIRVEPCSREICPYDGRHPDCLTCPYRPGYQRPDSSQGGESASSPPPTEGAAPVQSGKLVSMRPSMHGIFMDMAINLSRRSTCSRDAVGCVIASSDSRKVYSVGYNGNASGLDNHCDRPEDKGNCGCLHAEENAVINCTAERLAVKYVYLTRAPCEMCAKRLVNLGGVYHVYYTAKPNIGTQILHRARIRVYRLDGSYSRAIREEYIPDEPRAEFHT